ncbi:class I SAM-dependent methyltransferase [Spongiibacter taiwanensis]|uniref:class I SAM-dependent methyltransferase n=1 Tax=Spongiibacter taiwanensis TaxID=1748242 RepID=UPI002034B9F4|nr:class I SAM-dependent methyltransferase [Spongiibacter taiwanensis]USA41887.1 class I SAM-dependent methyltransferase [Spongiibacter taiwanensis]
MSFYEHRILPHLIDTLCSHQSVMRMREKVVPEARGAVLEVGMGSAINLPLYDPEKVDVIWGLEPSHGMRRRAQKNLAKSNLDVRWLDLPGEQIPLDDESVDTVLLTYTLCTIPDWQAALQQMHRVLKPDGRLLFCEHGRACHHTVEKWQHRVTPLWMKLAGGCHLNRDIDALIRAANFNITRAENCYMPGMPRIASYMYIGEAVKA